MLPFVSRFLATSTLPCGLGSVLKLFVLKHASFHMNIQKTICAKLLVDYYPLLSCLRCPFCGVQNKTIRWESIILKHVSIFQIMGSSNSCIQVSYDMTLYSIKSQNEMQESCTLYLHHDPILQRKRSQL